MRRQQTNRTGRYQLFIVVFILLLAAAVRLFNLSGYSEFLADQGRAGLIAFHAYETRTLPLEGPTTLRNQYLGPLFYHIMIVLFVAGSFNPIVPALIQVVLGLCTLCLVYVTIRRLAGFVATVAITLLWAISPVLIAFDQTIWEPHLIPLFSFLFVYATIRLWDRLEYRWWIIAGASLGCLLQLHYFNLFFLAVAGVFTCLLIGKYPQKKYVLRGIGYFAVALVIVLLPFILLQIQRQGQDLISIGSMILSYSTETQQRGERELLSLTLDYAGRMIGYLSPIGTSLFTRQRTLVVLLLVSFVLLWEHLQKKPFNIFFAGSIAWLFFGSLAMSLYNDVVYDHYLTFLLPAVVIVLAYILRWLYSLSAVIFLLIVTASLVSQFFLLQYRPLPRNDILRTETLTAALVAEAAGQPFRMTLFPASTVADLHYQFFIKKLGGTLVRMHENSRLIFLVCDLGNSCPVSIPETVPAVCWEYHCSGDYGTVDTTNFAFIKTIRSEFGTIYVLGTRTDSPNM